MALTRSEAGGLAIAAAGHVALFGLLSVGFLATPNAEKLKPQAVEISFAEDVALDNAAPVISSEAEAAKKSPVEAPVEPDSAPPEPVTEPEPVAKPQPAPPEPKPVSAPAPKPKPKAGQPSKPAPAAKPKPVTPPRPASAAKPTQPAKAASASPSSSPRQRPSRNVRPTGNLEGLDLGRTNNRTNSQSINPPAATMSAQASANIGSAIQRQVQPCADRQVNPGPGADQIRVIVNLRLNRDGSLAGPITIRGHEGVNDSNQRYVTRVDDAVRAIFAGCAPLRGLPDELYDVPRGWKSFTLRYRLRT